MINSHLIITPSYYTKNKSYELFPQLQKNKIIVIHPKVYSDNETKNFKTIPKNFLQKFGITNPSELPIVISIARLVKRKGFDTFLRLAKYFKEKAIFIIIGKGEEEQHLCNIIDKLNIKSTAFLITNDLTDDELSTFYRICDIFMFLPFELLNGDVEGFGQVVLEAQYFSKPVIVRNSGGTKEAFIHEKAGYLWNGENENQLMELFSKLLSSEAKRKTMGENGKKFALRLNQDFNEKIKLLRKGYFSKIIIKSE